MEHMAPEFQSILKENNSLFAYAKANTADISLCGQLENLGFRIVDTNVQLKVKKYHSQATKANASLVRESMASDQAEVGKIAKESFIYSRFHLDSKVDDSIANAIKKEWVENYYKGKRGDAMIVAVLQNEICGFVQLIEKENFWIIDLIAVSKKAQGKGIGKALIQYCFNKYKNFEYGIVGTQVSNIPSLNFYERLGYRVHKTQYVFHYNKV